MVESVKSVLRVVLVDDHEVVRLGLITLLEDVRWVEVVAEAGNVEEAVAAVARCQPDVVLMDVHLSEQSGIDGCQAVKAQSPEVDVVMLTASRDDELIFRALQAGATGYVLKEVGDRSLVPALDAVRRGETLLDPQTVQRLLRWKRKLTQ